MTVVMVVVVHPSVDHYTRVYDVLRYDKRVAVITEALLCCKVMSGRREGLCVALSGSGEHVRVVLSSFP